MQVKDESTQNLKTVNPESLTSWEESLPLPEEDQSGEVPFTPKVEVIQPEETPKVESVSPKTTLSALRILNKKIILISLLVFILVVVGLFFGLPIINNGEISQPQTPKSFAVVFRRISSAFIPKIPSSEPGNLSVNWIKFEDSKAGFSLLHPEEWSVSPGDGDIILILYYPVVDKNEDNFGKTVFAKFSVTTSEKPAGIELADFLLKRYNLSNVQIQQETEGEVGKYNLKFGGTFVSAVNSRERLFILEGKVAKTDDFEIFLPIFREINKTFTIL